MTVSPGTRPHGLFVSSVIGRVVWRRRARAQASALIIAFTYIRHAMDVSKSAPWIELHREHVSAWMS